MANRNFNRKQALEKEVKELFASGTFMQVEATATSNLTADIAWTDNTGTASLRNTNTITIAVNAAAANPTDTVLVTIAGTDAATTITVTPNDGTNNSATPVDLTTANLVQLINTGLVTGKTITLTDAGARRIRQTASGGDSTALAASGEGDGVVATFSGGEWDVQFSSKIGFSDIVQTAEGTFTATLEDKWYSLKCAKMTFKHAAGRDLRFQLKSESVSSGSFEFFTVTGATPTDPSDDLSFTLRLDLKNTTMV